MVGIFSTFFVKTFLERKGTYFCCVIFSIFECIFLVQDCFVDFFFLVKTLFKKRKERKNN